MTKWNADGEWLSLETAVKFDWHLAEAKRATAGDRALMVQRCWLRRVMWGLRATISLLILCAACGCIDHENHEVTGAYDGCDCAPVAKQLAWSLDHEGSEWSTDGYLLSRGSYGPVIWIANESSGLSAGPHDTMGEPWHGSDNDRALVWRAVQRWTAWKISGR